MKRFLSLPLFLFLLLLFTSTTLISSSTSGLSSDPHPSPHLPLLRNYSQISDQCRNFTSFSHKKLFFLDARRELNLTVTSPLNESLSCPYGGGSLNSTYGGLAFPINHSLVVYGRVFKVNSENVVYSFLQASNVNLSSDHFSLVNRAIGSSYFSELHERRQNRLLSQSMKVFSFFRHPMSHFLSGLTESHFRFQCQTHDTDITNPIAHQCIQQNQSSSAVTKKLAIDILDSIFSCKKGAIKKYLSSVDHFSPQSTTLHEWKPQFIGYLESFRSHWEELQVFINRRVPYIAYHQHVTQSDPFHINDVVTGVLRKQPKYARAICRLLMSDFMCFHHALPKVCQDMIDQDGNYVPFSSSA